MNTIISDYKKIKEFCESFEKFNIYNYLYYIGLTNVKEDISNEDLTILIEKM